MTGFKKQADAAADFAAEILDDHAADWLFEENGGYGVCEIMTEAALGIGLDEHYRAFYGFEKQDLGDGKYAQQGMRMFLATNRVAGENYEAQAKIRATMLAFWLTAREHGIEVE